MTVHHPCSGLRFFFFSSLHIQVVHDEDITQRWFIESTTPARILKARTNQMWIWGWDERKASFMNTAEYENEAKPKKKNYHVTLCMRSKLKCNWNHIIIGFMGDFSFSLSTSLAVSLIFFSRHLHPHSFFNFCIEIPFGVHCYLLCAMKGLSFSHFPLLGGSCSYQYMHLRCRL